MTQKSNTHSLSRMNQINEPYKYEAYTLTKLDQIEQLKNLPEEMLEDMRVVAHVLPFKSNNYIIEELINWEKVPNDPIFRLNFPQKGMLLPNHFEQMKKELETVVQLIVHIVLEISSAVIVELVLPV